MKKMFLCLSLLTFSTACKKNGAEPNRTFNSSSNKSELVDGQFKGGDKGMEFYIKNSKNLDDELINRTQFNLGTSMLEGLMDDEVVLEILNLARSSKQNAINLQNYLEYNSNFRKSVFKKLVEGGFGADGPTAFNNLKSKLVYNKTNYSFVIYIPNAQTAVFNGDFYLALGNDVENEDKDYIPCWKLKKNDKTSINLIDELHVKKSKDPVLILTILQDYTFLGAGESKKVPIEFEPIGKVYMPTGPLDCTQKTKLVNMECKLADSYESDNTIEYRALIYSLGSSQSAYGYTFNYPSGETKQEGYLSLVDIPSSWVGYGWTLGGQNGEDYWKTNEYCVSENITFVSFERDWYAVPKIFSNINICNFYIKAKFDSDYYQFTYGVNIGSVLTNGNNTNGWYLNQKNGYHGFTRT